MKNLAIISAVFVFAISNGQGQTNAPAKLIGTIPLPNVEGYFDHMAVDVKGQRLFVPGEHQRTIEVIDLRTNTVLHSITGFGGDPRKTIYLPETNEIWVDDGDDTCKAFSGDNYQLVKNIPLGGHDAEAGARRVPDNGVYDAATGLFYLGTRTDSFKDTTAKGSIEIVDLKNGKYIGGIEVDGRNPAGLVLDPNSSKLFVVMGDTSQVVVIDREKRVVLASWPITGGPEPHAVALDPDNHRLFVGSRVKRSHIYKPGKMVVMDSENGKVIEATRTEGGVDEVVFEPASKRIYYTGTTGFVDVFKQISADKYERLGLIATGAIAKTSLLVPELNRFYAAVPKHVILTPPIPQSKEATIEDAKILIFEIVK
ncbi:MAG TPA: YncE family protein [Bryobacteraceae bacterium]|nr:YncE family protein [Bryobacteraceae bacterium]